LSCDALQVVGFREDDNHYHYAEYDEYLSDSVLIRQKAGEFTEQMGHTVYRKQERLQRKQRQTAAEKKKLVACDVSHSIRQEHQCAKGATQVPPTTSFLGPSLLTLQLLKATEQWPSEIDSSDVKQLDDENGSRKSLIACCRD
jgi:hypothetical protein